MVVIAKNSTAKIQVPTAEVNLRFPSAFPLRSGATDPGLWHASEPSQVLPPVRINPSPVGPEIFRGQVSVFPEVPGAGGWQWHAAQRTFFPGPRAGSAPNKRGQTFPQTSRQAAYKLGIERSQDCSQPRGSRKNKSHERATFNRINEANAALPSPRL